MLFRSYKFALSNIYKSTLDIYKSISAAVSFPADALALSYPIPCVPSTHVKQGNIVASVMQTYRGDSCLLKTAVFKLESRLKHHHNSIVA